MNEIANFKFEMPKNKSAAIKVIGIGGGGSNAVNYMYDQGIAGVDFIVCNTDAQALQNSPVPVRIQLGASITEGLGAGANPEIGEQAALETMDEIKSLLEPTTKMVFITAGMGGGTGTGAAPIIASIAKEMGILTVGIVTAPFNFEGRMRLEQADKGIKRLQEVVDSMIVVNNDKLRELYGNLGYKSGFAKADEVLSTAAKGIAEVITHHYLANIDLHDAKTVLANSGTALMGTGKAEGEDKAKQAIEIALDSPLLNNNKITGATNVLLLIVSGEDEVTLDEIGIINDHIQQEAGNNANIIMGIGEDLSLGGQISVTIVATGFTSEKPRFTTLDNHRNVHTLEDEQPVEQHLSPSINGKEEDLGLDLDLTEDEFEVTSKEADKPTTTTESLEVIEPKTRQTGLVFSLDDDDDEKPVSKVIDKKQVEEKPDDDDGIRVTTKSTGTAQPKVQEPEEETELPEIDQNLADKIRQRRERLRSFNLKFNNSLKNNVEEVESTPAFKRQGLDLDTTEENESTSRYSLEDDDTGKVKIKPNNFLNDNVD